MDPEMAGMIPATHAPDGFEAAFASAEAVVLDHSWPAGIRASRSTVRVVWNSTALGVRADLQDEDVTTDATEDSQNLWKLGDVFEIFLEAQGAGFYSEMHVAPGNHRLHLHFRHEDITALKQKALKLDDLKVRPPGFESRCLKTPTGWAVEARIPAALIDPSGSITPQSRWSASFCRYDAFSDALPQ